MKWVQKRFGKYFSEKLFTNAFILWFLLFPFDAQVLPVSLGFFTIYPYLLLTFFLLFYSLFAQPSESTEISDNFVILFFFFWAAYGMCFYPFVNGKEHALFEIRSLILMSVTVCLLFRAKNILKANNFFEILHRLSLFLFIVLTGFALFEFFTGIHFAGKFTEKLWTLPVSMVTYAPVFLYDNPNNFMCYLFGLAIIIFLSDIKLNFKPLKMFLIISILFFFSVTADTKFGKILTYGLFFIWLVNIFITFGITPYKKYLWWSGIVAACLFFCFISKQIYMGPIWHNGTHYAINSLNPVCYDNYQMYFYSPQILVKKFGEEKVAHVYSRYSMRGTIPSTLLRQNLLKNGYFLLKKSNFMGVGPGQYRWLHENKMMRYPVTTVTTPHNALMEIVSQYGILIFIPYVLILFYYWFIAFRNRKNNLSYFITLTACFLLYIIISDMPSAFLILNIGWILIPVLLLSASHLGKIQND